MESIRELELDEHRQIMKPYIVRRGDAVIASEKVFLTDAIMDWTDPNKSFGDTIAITGKKRTGKTLTSVQIIVERLLNGTCEHVISNVLLDLTSINMQHKFKYFTDIEQIKAMGDSDVKYIFFLDELRRFADSRMSLTKKNRLISNLFADLGKQQVDFIFTDQDVGAVDNRIRVNIDLVISPKMIEQPIIVKKDNHAEERWLDLYCRASVFNSIAHREQYTMEMAYAGETMADKPIEMTYRAADYYKFFDTKQKIEDFHMKYDPRDDCRIFVDWIIKEGYKKKDIDGGMIGLWLAMEAIELSGKDSKSMLKWMKLNENYWLPSLEESYNAII